MSKNEDEFFQKLLLRSGVEVSDISAEFDSFWRKLKNVFLTNENELWFEKRYNEHLKGQAGFYSEYRQAGDFHRDGWPFWELFSFERLPSERGDSAIDIFNKMSVNECYVLHDPDYIDIPQLFYMKGAYDVSYISTLEEFNFIKTDIRKDVAIPFWTIYSLCERYGQEFYVFDREMNWILALTHEKDIFLYVPHKENS